MTQDSKLLAYKQHMAARGVSWATALPPFWHLLWWCGIRLPPPPFLGFIALAVLTGSLFGPLFTVGAWLIRFREFAPMSLDETLWMALGTGVAFGLAMAAYYRHLARKHGLGSWAAFPSSGSRS